MRGRTTLICTGLLAVFAALAWTAVRRESPTADEPYHALAAYLHRNDSDYRFDAEDPPLWQHYAALATPRGNLHSDFQQQDWTGVPMNTPPEFQWILRTFYRTPGNDADAFLARQRAMMLLVGIALGATIAGCAYRWAPTHKPVAAITAAVLFCFDPNFLAHAPLMKNDVVVSLAMLGVIISARSLGRRITPWRVIQLGLWCGVAVAVKFTGLLLVGIAVVLLIIRALLPVPWPVLGNRPRRGTGLQPVQEALDGENPADSEIANPSARVENPCHDDSIELKRVWARLAVAGAMLVLAGLVAFALLWASYGFRFLPSDDPHFQMDLATAVQRCQLRTWQAAHTDGVNLPVPDDATLAAVPVPLAARVALWLDAHRLLPQSWLAGFLYTYQSAFIRGEFLNGHLGCAGWWWYFPFAMLVKTPFATLAAFALTTLLIVGRWMLNVGCWTFAFEMKNEHPTSNIQRPTSNEDSSRRWTLLCLTLPIVLYLAAAMRTNLNLGLRHVFPVYPLGFVAVGLTTARCWSNRTAIVAAVLTVGLAAETLLAYPDFIPFFNTAAGGSRGGLRLLSDSNLDWGQDLKLLATWQRTHPAEKLYLAYFGQADPSYYGLRWTNIAPDSPLSPLAPTERPTTPGVLAISATDLQGPYLPQINHRPYFAGLYPYRPLAILGGSIYLFPYPLHPTDRLPGSQRLIGP